jgi:uncharacterized protein RhaS with RHS repeats
MQARYYDPVIGRFYSNDPVGAATFLRQGNVQGFNRYAYANNNPYKYTDPDGATPLHLAVGIGYGVYRGYKAYKAFRAAAVIGTAVVATDAILNESAPPLPEGLVGTQDDPRAGPKRGKGWNSGPLAPEIGGTGDPEKDFEKLTGGTGKPNPERPPGHVTGENNVTIRPGSKAGEGPRIDIPANGDKPPETLHYPDKEQ